MWSSLFLPITCLVLLLITCTPHSTAISLSLTHKLRSRSRQHQHQHQHQLAFTETETATETETQTTNQLNLKLGLERVCDVQQGLSYRPDVRTQIGYITQLTLAGSILSADLPGSNPLISVSSPGSLPAVVVLQQVTWAMRTGDPITFKGVISLSNAQRVRLLQVSILKDRSVSFWWTVYDWDLVSSATNKYFVSNSPTTTNKLNGIISSFNVDPTPTEYYAAPITYAFTLVVNPPTNQIQTMYIATSSANRVQKGWGLQTGGTLPADA